MPSGVNASTGEVAGAAVRADVTVTMHGPKVGLAVAPGRFLAGEVVVVDIGLEQAETEHRLVTAEILGRGASPRTRRQQVHVGSRPRRRRLARPDRSPGARRRRGPARRRRLRHDRCAGPVAAGSRDARSGGGEASARAGVRGSGEGRCARRRPRPGARRGDEGARPPPARRGRAAGGRRRGRALRARAGRVAGAARAHAARGRARPAARPRFEGGRCASARVGPGSRRAFGCVVVLKGEDSLVAAPGRGVLVCALGLPSLATAGTGDVLTGITAAFLAKGMEPQRAAAAACAAQQLASHEAEQRYGLVASDVVEALPRALALRWRETRDVPLRAHDRPRRPSPERRICCACSPDRSSGRSSRRTGTATALRRRGGRAEAGATALVSSRWPKASSCAASCRRRGSS